MIKQKRERRSLVTDIGEKMDQSKKTNPKGKTKALRRSASLWCTAEHREGKILLRGQTAQDPPQSGHRVAPCSTPALSASPIPYRPSHASWWATGKEGGQWVA